MRHALGPKDGDELPPDIRDGQVTLTKARVLGQDDRFTAFEEWDSEADRRHWPGDGNLGARHREAGHPARSLTRTGKIAMVESDRMEHIGPLPIAFMAEVEAELDTIPGRTSPRS